MRNMTSLLTLLTLRSARTSSPLNAMKHPNRFSTAAVVGHDSQVVSHGHAGYGCGKRD